MSRRFYYVRVSVLSLVLVALLVYAALDRARRSARREWQRPLSVAIILLQDGAVAAGALEQLQQRVRALETVLESEFARYGGDFRPVRFQQFGPVAEARPAPVTAAESSLWHSLRLSLEIGAFARENDRAAGLTRDDFDGKIYVRLSAPRSQHRSLVEGLGEDGGRIAITNLELREDSADFGLFVVAHELFHLLGATDRYGPDGLALLPDGLGDLGLMPRFPQRRAEVMARGRVLRPGLEVPPAQLDELAVGPRTALEIGWLPAGNSQ